MDEKQKQKPEGKSIQSRFGEYKGEFAKIIWPSRKELVKSSVTVIITCIIFGIAIFIMDLVFTQGMGIFTRLVG